MQNKYQPDFEEEIFATATSPEWYDENEHAGRKYVQPIPEINEQVYSVAERAGKKKEADSGKPVKNENKGKIPQIQEIKKNKAVADTVGKPEKIYAMQGSFGNKVREIQERLRQIPAEKGGTPDLEPDGIYGAKTAKAVMVFETSAGRAADGVVDGALYEEMKAAVK